MDEVTEEEVEAIRLQNVVFSYPGQEGTPAVNGITFSVKKGEFVSVLGQNGSGKSTLARLCNGLLEEDEGKVFVFGHELDSDDAVKEARKRVGIVFQNPDNQMVASIVEDDVAFGPENLGVEREEIGRRIEWALEAVGMSEYRHSTPERLSGGQKQRIAVAGVIAIKPDVIILDEATAMLDPRGRKEVISVVQKLNKEEGISVILITHFMEEALLADRAIVMHRGEIVMQGTPEKIFESGDMLATFNLGRPPVCEIRDALNSESFPLAPVLDGEILGEEIAENLKDAPKKSNEFTPVGKEVGGVWDIKIENLTYVYSPTSPFATTALKDVTLTISEGEFYGIIGHTGSGKTTLVQHFNALYRLPQAQKHFRKKKVKKGQPAPVYPQMHIGEYDLSDKKTDFKKLRSDVGMVFQYPEYQLFAETVEKDVAFGLKNFNKGISEEDTASAVKAALEAVGLDYDEVREKSPFDLSGGQKRRAAIAGVIVTRPKILILDEPAAGLDPAGKKEIMAMLHGLHESVCKTIIIVSHDMDEIAENCTRACVLSEGEIVFTGTPYEIFSFRDRLSDIGLDVPLTAKICDTLKSRGIEVKCDLTVRGFIDAVRGIMREGGEADA
ncbi:MAG: energy-coupling factor transporter ATPase [Clostridia bacterium]|nr:energy-coupling factor transporter ATPase [Clostridia bacterium]